MLRLVLSFQTFLNSCGEASNKLFLSKTNNDVGFLFRKVLREETELNVLSVGISQQTNTLNDAFSSELVRLHEAKCVGVHPTLFRTSTVFQTKKHNNVFL